MIENCCIIYIFVNCWAVKKCISLFVFKLFFSLLSVCNYQIYKWLIKTRVWFESLCHESLKRIYSNEMETKIRKQLHDSTSVQFFNTHPLLPISYYATCVKKSIHLIYYSYAVHLSSYGFICFGGITPSLFCWNKTHSLLYRNIVSVHPTARWGK